MKKKIAIILVIGVLLLFTACSNSNIDTSGDTTQVEESGNKEDMTLSGDTKNDDEPKYSEEQFEEIVKLYQDALKAYSTLALGTSSNIEFDYTKKKIIDGGEYDKVVDPRFSSVAEIKEYFYQYFVKELAMKYSNWLDPFVEMDGELYACETASGSNPFLIDEKVTKIEPIDENTMEVTVTYEILESVDAETGEMTTIEEDHISTISKEDGKWKFADYNVFDGT